MEADTRGRGAGRGSAGAGHTATVAISRAEEVKTKKLAGQRCRRNRCAAGV